VMSSLWCHHGDVIIAMSSWWCHDCDVMIVMSSWWCHHGDVMIVMSSLWCHHGDVIMVMSSLRCHHGDVMIVMSWLWCHDCDVMIVMSSWWCHHCDVIMVMSWWRCHHDDDIMAMSSLWCHHCNVIMASSSLPDGCAGHRRRSMLHHHTERSFAVCSRRSCCCCCRGDALSFPSPASEQHNDNRRVETREESQPVFELLRRFILHNHRGQRWGSRCRTRRRHIPETTSYAEAEVSPWEEMCSSSSTNSYSMSQEHVSWPFHPDLSFILNAVSHCVLWSWKVNAGTDVTSRPADLQTSRPPDLQTSRPPDLQTCRPPLLRHFILHNHVYLFFSIQFICRAHFHKLQMCLRVLYNLYT